MMAKVLLVFEWALATVLGLLGVVIVLGAMVLLTWMVVEQVSSKGKPVGQPEVDTFKERRHEYD